MSEFDMLGAVKAALNITGSYQDAALTAYIEDIKFFLQDAGVPSSILEGKKAIGVISRGVSDLWNYGSGEGKLSPYFYARAIQLKTGNEEESEGE